MSDLISRSEVNDVIDKLEVYTCGRPNTIKVEVSVLQLQRFINKLKNIPTAYDIDKIVEELELHSFELGTDTLPVHYVRLNDAIEIVKQGGVGTETETIRDKAVKWNNNSSKRVPYEFIDYVEGKRGINISDDVCEWKAGKSNDEWQPNCEPNSTYNVFGVAWFKRCPYCGKKIKIKVVE